MGCGGSTGADDNGVDKQLAAEAEKESKKVKLLLLGKKGSLRMISRFIELLRSWRIWEEHSVQADEAHLRREI